MKWSKASALFLDFLNAILLLVTSFIYVLKVKFILIITSVLLLLYYVILLPRYFGNSPISSSFFLCAVISARESHVYSRRSGLFLFILTLYPLQYNHFPYDLSAVGSCSHTLPLMLCHPQNVAYESFLRPF